MEEDDDKRSLLATVDQLRTELQARDSLVETLRQEIDLLYSCKRTSPVAVVSRQVRHTFPRCRDEITVHTLLQTSLCSARNVQKLGIHIWTTYRTTCCCVCFPTWTACSWPA